METKYDDICHKNRTLGLHHENMWNVSVRRDVWRLCYPQDVSLVQPRKGEMKMIQKICNGQWLLTKAMRFKIVLKISAIDFFHEHINEYLTWDLQ